MNSIWSDRSWNSKWPRWFSWSSKKYKMRRSPTPKWWKNGSKRNNGTRLKASSNSTKPSTRSRSDRWRFQNNFNHNFSKNYWEKQFFISTNAPIVPTLLSNNGIAKIPILNWNESSHKGPHNWRKTMTLRLWRLRRR
jgi:hypothetical protein